MKQSKIQDLTIETPLKVLSIYAIPMLISMFFQQAYNLVDSWIAGNYIGAAALGAVGTCYPLTVFLIAIASGLSLGTSIFCSRTYGAKEYHNVFMFATMSDVVVRMMFGSLFSNMWRLNGVWAVWPTAWIVGTALSVGLYWKQRAFYKGLEKRES